MQPNSEHLSSLLCRVIEGAIIRRDDPAEEAEKAAQAYAAGLAAYKAEISPSASQPEAL